MRAQRMGTARVAEFGRMSAAGRRPTSLSVRRRPAGWMPPVISLRCRYARCKRGHTGKTSTGSGAQPRRNTSRLRTVAVWSFGRGLAVESRDHLRPVFPARIEALLGRPVAGYGSRNRPTLPPQVCRVHTGTPPWLLCQATPLQLGCCEPRSTIKYRRCHSTRDAGRRLTAILP